MPEILEDYRLLDISLVSNPPNKDCVINPCGEISLSNEEQCKLFSNIKKLTKYEWIIKYG